MKATKSQNTALQSVMTQLNTARQFAKYSGKEWVEDVRVWDNGEMCATFSANQDFPGKTKIEYFASVSIGRRGKITGAVSSTMNPLSVNFVDNTQFASNQLIKR